MPCNSSLLSNKSPLFFLAKLWEILLLFSISRWNRWLAHACFTKKVGSLEYYFDPWWHVYNTETQNTTAEQNLNIKGLELCSSYENTLPKNHAHSTQTSSHSTWKFWYRGQKTKCFPGLVTWKWSGGITENHKSVSLCSYTDQTSRRAILLLKKNLLNFAY